MQINENYHDYRPPFDMANYVRTLIRFTRPEHYRGLKYITLTNRKALNHEQKQETTWSRGRKVRIVETRGLYHERTNKAPAGVVLFVDNICSGFPKHMFSLPLAKDFIVGEVFFHEIGHHVHYHSRPEYREREDVAEKWAKTILYEFVSKKHPVLVFVLKRVTKLLRAKRKHHAAQAHPG
jgi:hypothetical protein